MREHTDGREARRGRVQFDDFELDLASGELRRGGEVVSLQAQPARALALLVSRAGRLVLREELIEELWPETVVDYDQGLHNVVRVLRRTLDDDASRPRFLETVPRRGYRFVAPVVARPLSGAAVPTRPPSEPSIRPARAVAPVALVLATAALVLAALALRESRSAPEEIPTLAVLPFEGADARGEILGASLAEELTRELAVVPAGTVRVVGHASASRVGRDGTPPRDAGRRLGASHVVVGAVAEEAGGLELSVELVRVRDGARVWSDRVATTSHRLLVTKSALARELAARLGLVVGLPALRVAPELGPAPLELHLRARHHASRGRWHDAIPAFRGVLEEAPEFVAARVGLGEALLASSEEPGVAEEVRELADEALAADPDDVSAHLLRARVALAADWDWTGAAAHLRHAGELADGDARVHLARAAYLSSLGRHREALEAAAFARELDPLSVVVRGDLAMFCFWAEDWAGVRREAESLLELEPEARFAASLRLEALLRVGSEEAARRGAEGLYENDARLATTPAGGLHDAVLAIQEERWREREVVGPSSHVVRASLAAQRGRSEEALAELERAVTLRSRYVPYLPVDPHFASLRSDPRFQRLLRSTGHPLAAVGTGPPAEASRREGPALARSPGRG